MTEYRCLVVSPEGRSSWRTVDAASEKGAIARLVGDGLTPLEVKSGAMGLVDRLNQPLNLGRTLGIGEQSLILTQLATLIRAGLPIDRCLDLLRDQSPRPAQRDLLGQALAGIRSGQSLAFALEQRAAFPGYVIGVIRSAERSGRLGDALTSLAERLTASAATRRQLVTALTYPAAVLIATLLALALVLVLVVPQFEPIFAGQEERLPGLTRAVLALSALVNGHFMLLLAVLIGLPVLGFVFLRSEAGGALLQRGRRHIPGLMLRDQYLAAQFTGIFATLVGNGVTVVKALPLARAAIGSERWRRHLAEVEQRVREGSTLSAALATGAFVPTTAVRLIEVGERSGQLADTCGKASTIMGDAARARIDRIVSLANPIAIIALGGIVAMLVAGVMLGIFALGDFAG
jgi:type II secretory pathway component PulF